MFIKRSYQFVFKITLVSILLFGIIVLNALFSLSHAQQTSITSDGTMGTNVQVDNGNYVISEGSISGTNLFHSFGMFNVDTNESATFTGPDSIHNIIGRVTGGTQSWIDGLLRSTIDGANLFLLNPAGILFGPNASLDVNGSFHVSTADYLRFENGEKFYVNPSENSVLSVASPAAFGFLTDNPLGITTQQSALAVPDGETLSLIGGDIEIVGRTGVNEISAPSGRINIASVASPGEVIPNAPSEIPSIGVDSFQELGTITISESADIEAGGAGGGTVIIRGGRLLLENSYIHASAKAPSVSGTLGAGVDIQITNDVVLDNSLGEGTEIGTNVYFGVPDDSGGIRISADRLEVRDGAQIMSVAFPAFESDPASIGNSGDIEVTTNSLLVCDGSLIRTGTGGYGDSGDIIVKTGTLEVRDGGVLFSPVFGGSGNGGDIDITADSIRFSNAKYPGYLTGIQTYTSNPGTGKAGDVRLTTNSFEMSAGTEISTPTYGAGQGGNIDVAVNGDVSIQGTRDLNPWGNQINTGIFANTLYYGSGDGGNVTLTADSLEMTTKTGITASSYQWGSGNAGDVKIRVSSMELKDASSISSSALWAWGGNAGSVSITADSVFMSGPESSSDPFAADFTGVSTATGEYGGQGGEIGITANSMKLTNRSSISASSKSSNPGGNLEIDVGSLQVLNGSNIIASSFGTGDGGTINVTADTLRLSGVHPELYTDIIGKQSLSPSGIASQTGIGGGNAGDMRITAKTLEVLDGGRISAETFGAGDAGTINVEADNVLVSGVNPDFLAFENETGGPVESAASGILTNAYADVLGDEVTGKGGSIYVLAESLNVFDGGRIASETHTRGLGGDIDLTADYVTLLDDGVVSAKSIGAGDAGNIYISAADSFLMRESAVTTEAKQADGGNIKINADYMVNLWNSEITASVGGGPDTVGGNINIDPRFVTLSNSKVIANAFEGKGGSIQINTDVFIADLDSVVDASSQLGIDGIVDIRAATKVVGQSMKPLSEKYKSAVALLREPCIVRASGGKYSSFVVSGRDALPVEPGGLLPSPISN